ncbi:hypothetical protein GN244_ATG10130 [Phytophthora infestans]|uniref:Uncharacterized protein n=1 Tax=Phytophthora infestans TaxID=4787 RepID=A0A833SPZ2_PHYIN|nr:hypothetical protein GN244_ATG10130 [Phytophthora infestans]KAF4146048.1 hypothetical protein GN958_ATG04714 [Phytophthora infestans]
MPGFQIDNCRGNEQVGDISEFPLPLGGDVEQQRIRPAECFAEHYQFRLNGQNVEQQWARHDECYAEQYQLRPDSDDI